MSGYNGNNGGGPNNYGGGGGGYSGYGGGGSGYQGGGPPPPQGNGYGAANFQDMKNNYLNEFKKKRESNEGGEFNGGGGYGGNQGKPQWQGGQSSGGYGNGSGSYGGGAPYQKRGGGGGWRGGSSGGGGGFRGGSGRGGYSRGGGFQKSWQSKYGRSKSTGYQQSYGRGGGGGYQQGNPYENGGNDQMQEGNENCQQMQPNGNYQQSYNQSASQQTPKQPLKPFKNGSGKEPKKQAVIFELTSNDYFSIRFQGFWDNSAVQVLNKIKAKGFQTVVYEKENKCWRVKLEEYYDAFQAFQEFVTLVNNGGGANAAQDIANGNPPRQMNVELHGIPTFAFDLTQIDTPFSKEQYGRCNYYFQSATFEETTLGKFNYVLDHEKNFSMNNVPEQLREQLFSFQKEAVIFGIKRYGRFLLGDEMGVGKTIQAIAVSCVYQEDWPLLIICPSSLRFTWLEELTKWLAPWWLKDPAKDICLIRNGKDSSLLSNLEAQIYIISYELATKMANQIMQRGIKMIIADEAHFLKAHDSIRSRTLVPMLTRMKRLLLLTGTPMLARPKELYNLLKMLRPDVFNDFFEYAHRYCNPKESQYQGANGQPIMDYSGVSNTRELHFLLEGKIMIRRLKKDVLKELPPKIRQKITIKTNKQIISQIKAILKRDLSDEETKKQLEDIIARRKQRLAKKAEQGQIQGQDENHENNPNENNFESEDKQLAKVYRLSGEAKIKGVIEFIDYLIENEVKFILYAHHRSVMDALQHHLDQKLGENPALAYHYIRIDGQTPPEARQQYVIQFQESENCRVALLSITAACLGITLTASSTVVFAETNWTPAIMAQSEDRAHRIGQEAECVNIYYLYGQDTLDEVIYPMINFKSQIISQTLDDQRSDFKITQKRTLSQSAEFPGLVTDPSPSSQGGCRRKSKAVCKQEAQAEEGFEEEQILHHSEEEFDQFELEMQIKDVGDGEEEGGGEVYNEEEEGPQFEHEFNEEQMYDEEFQDQGYEGQEGCFENQQQDDIFNNGGLPFNNPNQNTHAHQPNAPPKVQQNKAAPESQEHSSKVLDFFGNNQHQRPMQNIQQPQPHQPQANMQRPVGQGNIGNYQGQQQQQRNPNNYCPPPQQQQQQYHPGSPQKRQYQQFQQQQVPMQNNMQGQYQQQNRGGAQYQEQQPQSGYRNNVNYPCGNQGQQPGQRMQNPLLPPPPPIQDDQQECDDIDEENPQFDEHDVNLDFDQDSNMVQTKPDQLKEKPMLEQTLAKIQAPPANLTDKQASSGQGFVASKNPKPPQTNSVSQNKSDDHSLVQNQTGVAGPKITQAPQASKTQTQQQQNSGHASTTASQKQDCSQLSSNGQPNIQSNTTAGGSQSSGNGFKFKNSGFANKKGPANPPQHQNVAIPQKQQVDSNLEFDQNSITTREDSPAPSNQASFLQTKLSEEEEAIKTIRSNMETYIQSQSSTKKKSQQPKPAQKQQQQNQKQAPPAQNNPPNQQNEQQNPNPNEQQRPQQTKNAQRAQQQPKKLPQQATNNTQKPMPQQAGNNMPPKQQQPNPQQNPKQPSGTGQSRAPGTGFRLQKTNAQQVQQQQQQ